MFKNLINKTVLGNFFDIELTSIERAVAEGSVKRKYHLALRRAIFYSLLSIFPILFLDTSVIISVLIPITMVAGTAWFAISLAHMKQKFEAFGIELTANLFEAFAISLGLLFFLSAGSLSSVFWKEPVLNLPYQSLFQIISFVFGLIVIGNIVYKIFIGSIKYDINDSMLTGQNEAAEKFYRKALSLLNSIAESLKQNRSLQVANCYIGIAFYEVFSYMKKIGVLNGKLKELTEKSNQLVKNPSMSKDKADAISLSLIKTFVEYCKNPQGSESEKSLQAISDEVYCLEKNKGEEQEMVDTRLSVVFQEIANLLEGQGETLFMTQEKEK